MGFFDSYFKVEVTYDSIKKTYTILGPLRLETANKKYPKVFSNVFETILPNKVIFHQVFLPEVIALFNYIINNNNVNANVNLLKSSLEELEKLVNIKIDSSKNKYELDLSILDNIIDKKPLPHMVDIYQKYGSYKASTGNRGLLLDAAPGTSKTMSSLSIAEMLKAKKVVVITPSNALYKVWVKSIVGYSGDKSEYKNPKANTVWTSRDNTGYKDERFVIVHYEALETLLFIINKVADKETVVIVDESHNFADTKSKRTNLLVDIVDRSMSNHILLLSGTPIKSYSTEIINIARLIDIEIRGDILNRLLNIYKSPVSFFQPLLIERYQNLSFKVEKKEVNLKPVTKIYVPIKLKNGNDYTLDTIKQNMQKYINERLTFIGKHLPNYEKAYVSFLEQIINAGWEKKSKYTLKEYQKLFTYIQDMSNKRMLRLIPKEIELCNKIEKEMSTFLLPQYRTDWHETKTILKYPILKIQGECLGKIVMGARIACHKDIARELDYIELLSSTTKKTIIFSNYTEVCDEAKSRVEGLKLKPIYVYGNKTKDLTKEVDTFTKDKKRNPMITTYKSLSTAVPLTVANVIIALDLPFRMYIFEQAVSRVWRIGQDQEVLVYIPTLDTGDKPNINQRNFDIISFFNNAVEEMTGYQSSLTVDETIKAMATQFFLNLESMSAVHDLMHTDFNYDAYIQHNYNKKMLYW